MTASSVPVSPIGGQERLSIVDRGCLNPLLLVFSEFSDYFGKGFSGVSTSSDVVGSNAEEEGTDDILWT